MIKNTFMDFYPLDDSVDGKKGFQKAMETPALFVLKPQREGGGINIIFFCNFKETMYTGKK